MAKKRKSSVSADPFATLLNPFSHQSSPQAMPRKRAKAKSNEDSQLRLSSLIERERMAKGWTQKDLAERANVGLRQVSELERGRVNFTFTTLSKVLAVLGYELTPQPIQDR